MPTFRKTRRDAPPGFFAVEAAGLAWLRDADAAARFGRQLAALHDAGADAFGAPPALWSGDGFIGDAPLPLRREPTWGRFYARHRLAPYLGALTPAERAPVEVLIDLLEDGAFDDDAPPARLHGDLWSGNVVFTPRGGTLIDPAAHGGHRLTDLAMLCLFGAPHLPVILDAYADASVHLPADWRGLVGLHQVHPLLVHATLFGGGYGARAARAAASAAAGGRPQRA